MKFILLLIPLFLFAACSPSNKKTTHKFLDSSHDHTKKIGKTRGFINVEITETKRDDLYIYLNANVQPMKDMDASLLKWQIPKGIETMDGSTEQYVDLKSGVPVSLNLTINRAQLKNDDKIFFFAHQERDGERYGTSISYLYKELLEEPSSKEVQEKSQVIQKKKMIQ